VLQVKIKASLTTAASMERPEEPGLFMLFHPDFFHATPEKFCQFDGRPSLFKSVFNKSV